MCHDASIGPRAAAAIRRAAVRAAILLLPLLFSGCPSPVRRASRPAVPVPPPCPADAPAPAVLPFQQPVHGLADFWIRRAADKARPVSLDAGRIEEHNRRVMDQRKEGWPSGRWDLLALNPSFARVQDHLQRRLHKLRQDVQQGKRVLADGTRPDRLLSSIEGKLRKLRPAGPREVRVVFGTTALRCFPTRKGLYEKPWDLPFDLVQCSELRPGEAVRVLARVPGFFYVWSSYTEGWVDPARLTPPLDPARAAAYLRPRRFAVVQRERAALWADRERTRLAGPVYLATVLPLLSEETDLLQVLAPGPGGLGPAWLERGGQTSVGFPAFSREALWRQAFSLLNTTYGWGGEGGTRDCSRFMMDLLGSFGILVPRNSWHQSLAGLRHVEVEKLDEAQKVQVIEQTARSAVVLLYLPGHIMLYLGRDGEQLFALHLFSGFLEPCPGGKETMYRVNRAVVTSLELGRGSSRRAFIERITRLVLFE